MIPGIATLAMLMTGVEAYDWLSKEIEKYKEKILDVYGFGSREERKRSFVQVVPQSMIKPRLDPFGEYARFFTLTAHIQPEEIVFQEFMVEINRKIYGLINSLTEREREVLQKRLVEPRKSITESASEMGITPQAVVAFMASIKKKVQKHLYLSES